MFKLTFNPLPEVAAERIRARGPQIIQAILRAMTLDTLKLQKHIQEDKLSGQVLNLGQNKPGHSAGTLKRSIRTVPAAVEGDVIKASVLGGGADAWYGIVHEDGPTTIPAVTGKLMVFPATAAFGGLWRGTGGTVFTMKHKAFTLPQRSFMRSSLEDLREEIRGDIRKSVIEALHE